MMISKLSPSSPSQQFVAFSSSALEFDHHERNSEDYKSNLATVNQSLDNLFKELEMERSASFMKILTRTMNQVLSRCSKVLELGSHSTLSLPVDVMNQILIQMVILAEQEPYGVKGGTLVVMFSPPKISSRITRAPIKIGRFPLDPTTVSTYELHLSLQETCPFGLKLANVFRKIQGKAVKLVIDEKFVLVKKKLYRSSTYN